MTAVEPLGRWPARDEPGRFVIRCSCQWTFTGTAAEIDAASRGHDDSPWRKHVVSIAGRVRDPDPGTIPGIREHNCRFEYCQAPTGECDTPE